MGQARVSGPGFRLTVCNTAPRLRSAVLVVGVHIGFIAAFLCYTPPMLRAAPPPSAALRVVAIPMIVLMRPASVGRAPDAYGWLRQQAIASPITTENHAGALGGSVFGCLPERLSRLSAEDRAACIKRLGWTKAAGSMAQARQSAQDSLWQAEKVARDRPVQLPCTGTGGDGPPRTLATPAAPPPSAGTAAVVSINPICVLSRLRGLLE